MALAGVADWQGILMLLRKAIYPKTVKYYDKGNKYMLKISGAIPTLQVT